jgi:hypothetical protein
MACFRQTDSLFLHAFKRLDQRIDFGGGVVEGEGRAAGRRHLETLHHRLRAVVAGADRHAVVVEQRTDVVRMHALHREGQHRGLFLGSADQAHAGHAVETVGGVVQQVGLVGGDALDADAVR